MSIDIQLGWPRKYDVFGVGVSATTYEEAEELLIEAARRRQSVTVTHMAVHALITAVQDENYRQKIAAMDIVAPDGQPVRAALSRFHGVELPDRVYGPELMIRLCRRAALEGIGVYLYGSTPEVLANLRESLEARFTGLRIVGSESPPFRKLTPEEDEQVVQRINDSGAGLVFVGLGCPKQDHFAADHRDRIHAVQLCVGAAFDFHAGTKPMAPSWMQRSGLEWVFRLCQEPSRLWRRYLITNSLFCFCFARRLALGH